MRFKIFIILILLTFFLPIVQAAYADYGINELIVPQSIKEGEDLNYTITLSNSSGAPANVSVQVYLLPPTGATVDLGSTSRAVPANGTADFNVTVDDPTAFDFVNSNNPYSLYATITNEGTTGNVANNAYTKYFTVRKASKKIPIPDMPIVLGMVLAISIVFILARDNKFNKNKK